MTRPVRALIHTQALPHNLRRVRDSAPNSRVMGIIKADGYGHGLVRAARWLSDCDAFGVACLEEALQLREAGVTQPLVLLEGVFEHHELAAVAAHGLEVVVHNPEQIAQLEAASLDAPIPVWLKLDTGMHRLGFRPAALPAAWQRLQACPNVAAMRLMTHLAYADDRDDPHTAAQLELLDTATRELGGERSAANSGGILGWPQGHLEWVRPGLMLYGASPFLDTTAGDHGLQPAMTFQTRLIAVHQSHRGDAVGYGGQWVCPEDMPVGVAAVGYGDGYPRHAPNGTPVLVNGRRASLIGRVSMDMIQVDLRGQPDARPGDEVVLWGSGLPVEEIARWATTIPYELLCGVAERVPLDEV